MHSLIIVQESAVWEKWKHFNIWF